MPKPATILCNKIREAQKQPKNKKKKMEKKKHSKP